MKTLLKLSEYIKLQEKNWNKETIGLENSIRKYKDVVLSQFNYTNFIIQPLNISHFIPATEKDGKWIVLKEPQKTSNKNCTEDEMYNWGHDCQEYQTALHNVIFKGYKLDFFNGWWLYLRKGDIKLLLNDFTIEDLIPYNLEVNENIIKKFGL